MSEYNRELPNGGTVRLEFETEDELLEQMLVEHMDIGIQAARNVEEAGAD